MAQNILVQTLILLFGISFGFRIAGIAITKLNLDTNLRIKIEYIVIFLMVICAFVSFYSLILYWWIVALLIFVGLVTIFVTLYVQKKKLRQDFVFFVDKIILQIKIGRSLRASLEKSVEDTPLRSRVVLRGIVNSVLLNQNWVCSTELEREIYEEIASWYGMNQKILYRLTEYRSQLQLEERFRRKSEQLIHQVQIQISLLLLMYLLMTFFIFQRFSIFEHLSSWFVSLGLFTCGIGVFYYLTRRKIWKI